MPLLYGFILLALIPRAVMADLQTGSLFTDHMVLQRDLPVPVWGRATPAAIVTVEFADQKKTAAVAADGKWMATLEAMPASVEPRTMTISSSAADLAIACTDIVVGEVWICSGQSNMQLGVKAVPEVKALIPRAKNIRTFAVKRSVAFTEQDNCDGTWVERHPDSAVACGFAQSLQVAADVPVGIILSCWGSTSIEAWMPRDMTETVPHFKIMMDEFDANTEARRKISAALSGPRPWSRGEDVFMRRQSNIVYNAMMHPLAPYACRGLVWYQGERNTQSMFGMIKSPWWARNSGMLRYGEVLQKWMQRYRQAWNREDFHFLVVMLPGYGGLAKTSPKALAGSPAAHSWAWMREAQLKALDLAHAGVANSIDLGDVKNVHPRDKLPIGQRLALLAARDTLGQQIEAQGPILRNIEPRGQALVVHFDHAAVLKTTDSKAPSAFWLADDARQWVQANAKIEGNSVVLQAPDLSKPLYVRYAFVGKPAVNLVNAANLPAYPFRTDHFEPQQTKK